MIEIDGSYLEGGGQIIRTALALSAYTGKAFKVDNIRVGRKKPGLKNQHLFGVKALKELCEAEVKGDSLGSLDLEFKPKELKGQDLMIDIGTAGSITLLLQGLLLPSMMSGKRMSLEIIGGTDTKWSPPYDYLRKVVIPHLQKYCHIDVKLERRGFYPKGRGMVKVSFAPKEVDESIDLVEQGELIKVSGLAFASNDLSKSQVCERMAGAASSVLKKLEGYVKIETEYSEAYSSGAGIVLWASFSSDGEEIDVKNPVIIGADVLGERGKKAELVGEDAAKKLIMEIESKGAVDQHLADQLVPFLGLFGGKIKTSSVTQHTLTNIYVVEKFLDVKFKVDGQFIEVSS